MADRFTEHAKIYYDSIITVYMAMCCTFLLFYKTNKNLQEAFTATTLNLQNPSI